MFMLWTRIISLLKTNKKETNDKKTWKTSQTTQQNVIFQNIRSQNLISLIVLVFNTHLECGINNGEPSDGGMFGAASIVVAAVSGCRKLRRWSTRSWCWVKHRVISSGSASNWSFTITIEINIILSPHIFFCYSRQHLISAHSYRKPSNQTNLSLVKWKNKQRMKMRIKLPATTVLYLLN